MRDRSKKQNTNIYHSIQLEVPFYWFRLIITDGRFGKSAFLPSICYRMMSICYIRQITYTCRCRSHWYIKMHTSTLIWTHSMDGYKYRKVISTIVSLYERVSGAEIWRTLSTRLAIIQFIGLSKTPVHGRASLAVSLFYSPSTFPAYTVARTLRAPHIWGNRDQFDWVGWKTSNFFHRNDNH